jgi:hypothetical protein
MSYDQELPPRGYIPIELAAQILTEGGTLRALKAAEIFLEIATAPGGIGADGSPRQPPRIVARFLLEKILPAARSAPVAAPVELEGTAAERAEQIVDLLSAGSLTLEEGAAMMSALASLQNIRDAAQIGERLSEIEARLATLAGGATPALLPKPDDA